MFFSNVKLIKSNEQSFQKSFISLVFHRLLSFVLYACYKNNTNGSTFNSIKANEVVAINFVPFGEKALLITANLYDEFANHEAVIENLILKSIIQVSEFVLK